MDRFNQVVVSQFKNDNPASVLLEAARQTRRMNEAVGTTAIVDIIGQGNEQLINIASKGDTAVIAWAGGEKSFPLRRNPRTKPELGARDPYFGEPSAFQLLTFQHNRANESKSIEPDVLRTHVLDVNPLANQITHHAFDGEHPFQASYARTELGGVRFLLLVTDGAQPNSIIDSSGAERINADLKSGVLSQSSQEYPQRYRQYRYQLGVQAVMESLERGEISLKNASSSITALARNTLRDHDDITVVIIDLGK